MPNYDTSDEDIDEDIKKLIQKWAEKHGLSALLSIIVVIGPEEAAKISNEKLVAKALLDGVTLLAVLVTKARGGAEVSAKMMKKDLSQFITRVDRRN